ncbi:uncharacterized protein LOC125262766 [Megalobrama amblycephala]|uniref:uncharacterized protein LOC125262766 n=1 Tax=Megalobrama amblycephala TaxID=75352 RepID=UPI0020146BF4|nr:uncharacterized protein LOC125262766 [Megalobrama amblycephala]
MCFPGKCSHMALLDAKKTTTPINGRWREIMLKSKRRKTPLQDAEDHMTRRADKPGLQEQFISKYKGRGVFTTRAFFRRDFVLEYRGELLSSEESLDRTEHYTEAENAFLFDFQWRGRNWCMDASKEDCSLGRLVNDEHRNPTCKMRTLEVSRKPHLCLFAVRDILPGEEITFNHGYSDWPWRVKPLNQASTESSDKKPSISLGLQRSPHCAAPVSSPGLDEVNSSGPHKQSGKARTSRKTSSLVASATDASSSSAPCAVSTSVMTSSPSPYYRLPEGTLQLAKMSKVLMAMEKGTLSDFKGKKHDDIEIDPNEQLEAQGDSMSSDEEDYSDVSQTTAPAETDPPVQSDQSVSQEDQGSSNAPKKKWEDNEVKAVERHMMKFIKTCKVPGKQDCERCIHAEPEALKQRTWTRVKNYVRNRITTLKRKGGL